MNPSRSFFFHFLSLFAIASIFAPHPLRAQDYDGDGYDDYTGEYVGDSTGANSGDGSFDPWGDDDNDGLFNQEEIDMDLNPTLPDTDADGLWDGEEVYGIIVANSPVPA